MMGKIKIKEYQIGPCRICGHTSAPRILDTEEEGYGGDVRQYAVVCDHNNGGCGSSSGFRDRIEYAIQLWNGSGNMSNNTIKDSGDRTQFETGAVRDMHEGKGRMDLLPMTAIIELSKHCEEGAKKYGEHNVDKGIPQHSLCDSAMRHLTKYMRGDQDENHIRAAAWNMMWALNQSVERPELNDLPWAKKEEA